MSECSVSPHHKAHTVYTTVSVPLSELGPPHPLFRKQVSPGTKGGDTLACGLGGPNADDWIKGLALYCVFILYSINTLLILWCPSKFFKDFSCFYSILGGLILRHCSTVYCILNFPSKVLGGARISIFVISWKAVSTMFLTALGFFLVIRFLRGLSWDSSWLFGIPKWLCGDFSHGYPVFLSGCAEIPRTGIRYS